MLQKFFKDIFLTASAFTASSLAGFVLVPFFIHAYGVSGLGLIVLSRLFLPSGTIGLLDFGISEISTVIIASARGNDRWDEAKSRLISLLRLTGMIGIFAAVIEYLLINKLIIWLQIPRDAIESFAFIIFITSISLPFLMVGLFFEGITKGFENFFALRISEIISTLLYVSISLTSIYFNKSFIWPVMAFLLAQYLKFFTLGVLYIRFLFSAVRVNLKVSKASNQYVFKRAHLLLTSRILSTGQHQIPSLLVGALIGPVGVGLFDLISRIPRFCKGVFALIGSSVLVPVASRLSASGDRSRLRQAGYIILSIVPAFIFPPLAALGVFSGDVLYFWLGNQSLIQNACWLTLYLLIPALNTVVSLQNSTLMNRSDYLRRNNRISAFQLLIQIIISLICIHWFSQNSFIIGQIAASMFAIFWQLKLANKYIKVPHNLRNNFFCYLSLTIIIVSLMFGLLSKPVFDSILELFVALICLTSFLWILTYHFFLDAEAKFFFIRIVGALRKVVYK
jgi:O-antigen/teichoic acid export membrane protein